MKIFSARISLESVKEGLRFKVKVWIKIAQIHYYNSVLAKPTILNPIKRAVFDMI